MMYTKKLQLREPEFVLTKDERYELIAMIAEGYSQPKESSCVDVKQVQHGSEMELNFDEIVSCYN